eukprot:246207_1
MIQIMITILYTTAYFLVDAKAKGLHGGCASGEIETGTLCVSHANIDGFGDSTNQYAWSMTVFKGSLYVGTLNAYFGVPLIVFGWNTPIPSNGTQIWKGNPTNINGTQWKWIQVMKEGNGDTNNFGMRKLIVVGEQLYGVTANILHGFELWRSPNGTTWERVKAAGFGDEFSVSGRGLVTFNDYLYVGAENRVSGAKIFRRAINTETGYFIQNSYWEEMTSDGFGGVGNFAFSDFTEYNGYLYAGTWNNKGMGLYRTKNGNEWEMIYAPGALSRWESGVMKLYVYKNKLYFGTMNFLSGCSLYVNTDDDGTVFETVFTGGNGNRMNIYLWYMLEFNNRLYVGTYNMRGEFDLFSIQNPMDTNEKWVTETDDAFDQNGSHEYGIRTITIFEDKMMIGSATSSVYEAACQVFEANIKN